MSSIKFDADLDTSKLEAGAKRATKIMADFVKQAEKAGVSVEQYLGEAIQKQHAKISKLVAKTNAAFDVIRNRGALSDADYTKGQVAFNKLANQRDNAIRKLEVMKLAEQSAQKVAKEGVAVVENQAEGLGSLIGVTSKAAIVTAVLGAAVLVFKGVMNSSYILANKFGDAISYAKGSLQGFFNTIRTGDLSSFGENMRRAAQEAVALNNAQTLYNRQKEAQKIVESGNQGQLNELMFQMRNEENSLSERQANYKEYVQIRKTTQKQELLNTTEYINNLTAGFNKLKNLETITPDQVIKTATLPFTDEKLLQKFDAFRVKVTSPFFFGDVHKSFEEFKKTVSGAIPVGVSFEDMLAAVQLRANLAPKDFSLMQAGVLSYKQSVSGTTDVLKEMSRLHNSLFKDADASAGSSKKLNYELNQLEDTFNRIGKEGGSNLVKKVLSDEIAAKKREIADLEGVKSKSYEVTQIEYNKEQARKAAAAKLEFSQAELNLQKSTEKAKLDIQSESSQAQRDQAEVDFQKKLNDIKNQQVEELIAYNKTSAVRGIDAAGNKVDGRYKATLPENQQKIIDQKIVAAQMEKSAKIIDIDIEEKRALKQIRETAENDTLTSLEKELDSIRRTYDEKFKEIAKYSEGAAKESATIALISAENKAIKDAKTAHSLEMLKNEEELQTKLNELRAKGFFKEENLEKANFETYVKYAKLKIALKLSSGDPRLIAEAAAEKADLDLAIKKEGISVLGEELTIRKAILANLGEIGKAMANLLGMTKEESDSLSSMMQAYGQGGEVGYVMNFITQFVSAFASIFDKSSDKADEYAAQLERINFLLERNQKLIDQSLKSGGAAQAYQERINLLEKEIATITANFEAEFARMKKDSNKFFNAGPKPPSAEIQAAIIADAIAKAKDDLEAAKADYQAFLTGGVASTDISSALRQGFEEGKSSAADFAQTFNDFMVTAINSALEEASKPAIAKWYKDFAAGMESEGGLDSAEIAALKEDWDKIVADSKASRDAMFGVAGINPNKNLSQASTLSGTIQRNITEDTGTELAGLMRKISDDNRMNRDYNKLGVDHLINIEANTFNTVVQLQLAVLELQGISKNTKPLYTGVL